MAFTAQDVKTLREMTNCGMMDCKKALTETDGDMEKAVEVLREKGLAKAAKKAGRIAAEGLVSAAVYGNTADWNSSAGRDGCGILYSRKPADFCKWPEGTDQSVRPSGRNHSDFRRTGKG